MFVCGWVGSYTCVPVRTNGGCGGLCLMCKCTCKRSLPRTFYKRGLLRTDVPGHIKPITSVFIPCVRGCMWECGEVVYMGKYTCFCLWCKGGTSARKHTAIGDPVSRLQRQFLCIIFSHPFFKAYKAWKIFLIIS